MEKDRLKFRMWDGYSGKYFDEETDPLFENVYECMRSQIFFDSGNPLYGRLAYNHAKDGRIFEQCTGLKDKNGKLIYENDLIKIDDDIAVIKWSDYYARFMLESQEDNFDFETTYSEECEVIGNIHENADLLEI